ncbi:Transmembrane protein 265 [Merluccius polli]|uniref:Transmembrane protein 265 n=1 Tax=Merluccius polli TaxID=89951 RepID=A0AA47PBU6_MERPO|nr:Transmembrane protein 265 [Merluccius polli]
MTNIPCFTPRRYGLLLFFKANSSSSWLEMHIHKVLVQHNGKPCLIEGFHDNGAHSLVVGEEVEHGEEEEEAEGQAAWVETQTGSFPASQFHLQQNNNTDFIKGSNQVTVAAATVASRFPTPTPLSEACVARVPDSELENACVRKRSFYSCILRQFATVCDTWGRPYLYRIPELIPQVVFADALGETLRQEDALKQTHVCLTRSSDEESRPMNGGKCVTVKMEDDEGPHSPHRDLFHRRLAVSSIICGLSCIGIMSLVYSVKAETARTSKDQENFSKQARKYGMISIVVWLAILITFPVLIVLVSYLLTLID